MFNMCTYCLTDKTRDNLSPIVRYYSCVITHGITVCRGFWKTYCDNLM